MAVLPQDQSDAQMTIIRERARAVATLADGYTTRRPDPTTVLSDIAAQKAALDAALTACTAGGVKNYNV